MMDSSFFQTDFTCIESWRTVIDNLMTHDRTTFKDLLGKQTVLHALQVRSVTELVQCMLADAEQRSSLW